MARNGRQSAPTEPVSGREFRMRGPAPAAQPSSASSSGLGRERSLCTTTEGPSDGARSKVFYRRRGDRAVQVAGSSGSIDGLPDLAWAVLCPVRDSIGMAPQRLCDAAGEREAERQMGCTVDFGHPRWAEPS